MQTIDLPWPSRDLHPNARVHHMVKARAAKAARRDAAWSTVAAGIHRINAPGLHITITFYPPDNRARDLDGMLSAMKPALDGVSDVTGIDDSRWQFSLRKGPPVNGGLVRLELEASNAQADHRRVESAYRPQESGAPVNSIG